MANGEEKPLATDSGVHHASPRFAWILVALLSGLLLPNFRSWLPVDISISWKPLSSRGPGDEAADRSRIGNGNEREPTRVNATTPGPGRGPRLNPTLSLAVAPVGSGEESDTEPRGVRIGSSRRTRSEARDREWGGDDREEEPGWTRAERERGDPPSGDAGEWPTARAEARPKRDEGSWRAWAAERPDEWGGRETSNRTPAPEGDREEARPDQVVPVVSQTLQATPDPAGIEGPDPPADDSRRIADAVRVLDSVEEGRDGTTQAAPASAEAVVPGAGVPRREPGSSPAGEPAAAARDPGVVGASCSSCGGSGRLAGGGESCSTCGGTGTCFPGRKACYPIEAHTVVGRFFANLYECLCCPDPCYRPGWVPEANASLFVDYARPQTITRFRYDAMPHLEYPDRNEYWWPQAMYNHKGQFMGKGPRPPQLVGPRGNPVRGWSYLDMNVGSFYTEAAAKNASFFVEIPYESFGAHPRAPNGPPNLGALRHTAGFSDMNLGSKTLLLDCELMQLTFQFRTYLPIGNFSTGLGNGHVSLEPSLLTSIKLGPETYFQGQLAEWIPIGGDADYAGAILKYAFSFNQVLYRCTPEVPLIGTFEMQGWTFQDGLYTNPFTGPAKSSNETYFNLGPGVRMSICKRIDFGAAVTWPVSFHYWADPSFRTELRVLY